MTPPKGTAGLGAVVGAVLGYQGAGVGGALLAAALLAAGGYAFGAVADRGFGLFGSAAKSAANSALRVWPSLVAVAGLALVVLLTWGLRL